MTVAHRRRDSLECRGFLKLLTILRLVVVSVICVYGLGHLSEWMSGQVPPADSAFGWWSRVVPAPAPLVSALLLGAAGVLGFGPVDWRHLPAVAVLLALTAALGIAHLDGVTECGCGGSNVLSLSPPLAYLRNGLLLAGAVAEPIYRAVARPRPPAVAAA